MADVEELFNGDEPPTAAELRRWLDANTDVSPNVADAIVSDYNAAPATDAGNWSAYSLGQWVDDQVESFAPQDEAVVDAEALGVEPPRNESERRRQQAEVLARDAEERSRRTRQRTIPSWLEDAGPSVDPAALAQSIAVGVFTDAAGNVRIDPETGTPVPVSAETLWMEIKGTRFDMGMLRLPRPVNTTLGKSVDQRTPLGAIEEGLSGGRRTRHLPNYQEQVERRRFLTPSQVMAMLSGMDEDYLTTLQQQLWEAGLYGDVAPSWGIADETTRKALMAMFAEASITPDASIDQVLSRLIDERVTRMATEEGAGGAGAFDVPAFQPEVASAETLGAMIDDIAQDLFGQFVDPDRKADLIAKLQERETSTQRQQYDRDVAEATRTAGVGPGGTQEIDAFMAAIAGKESGGDYGAVNPDSGASGKFQIMPANWGPWAERAGLGRNAPRSPENQEAVARFMMGEYYRQFGNWRDVAIAWYAGPGRVGASPGTLGRPQGRYPSINAYADDVMARFNGLKGGTATVTGGTEYAPIERFDPTTEAEAILKAQDPIGWQGHEFGERAAEFYSLLQGVI